MREFERSVLLDLSLLYSCCFVSAVKEYAWFSLSKVLEEWLDFVAFNKLCCLSKWCWWDKSVSSVLWLVTFVSFWVVGLNKLDYGEPPRNWLILFVLWPNLAWVIVAGDCYMLRPD